MPPTSSLTSPPPRRLRIQPTRPEAARVVCLVRNQSEWVARDVESALAASHPARSTWELLEWLDLSAFYMRVQSLVAGPGSFGHRASLKRCRQAARERLARKHTRSRATRLR